jgi:hypothetical protein
VPPSARPRFVFNAERDPRAGLDAIEVRLRILAKAESPQEFGGKHGSFSTKAASAMNTRVPAGVPGETVSAWTAFAEGAPKVLDRVRSLLNLQ